MSRIKRTIDSISRRARQTARGSLPPAGTDAAPAHGVRDRRLLRQRLRRTRHVREARLTELGVLVAEMQRRGRWNDSLVEEWTDEIERAAREQGELDEALRGGRPLGELVGSGLVAQCETCGRIGGSADRYCAGCGSELTSDSGKTLPVS
jgi:hypothetical protein